jgi:hypothetical protein
MLEFGMTNKEKGLLHAMLHKYLRKEVLRQTKGIQYYELVNIVLGSKIAIATKEEIRLANKLFIAYKINVKELIMELKELKAFGKEVGLGLKEMKGLDEEELTILILKNLDAEAEYSEEFIEWYNNEVPEELADEADALEEEEEKPKGKGKKEKEEPEEEEEEDQFEELIEAINDASDKEELEELLEDDDFAEIFEDFDSDDYKTTKKLKKAMLEAIEAYKENESEEEEEEEKPKGKGKKEKEVEKEEKPKGKRGRPAQEKEVIEVKDKDKKEMVESINDAEETEELKEVADTFKEKYPELFKGISFRQGRGKSPWKEVDDVRAEMLERLGEEAEEKEEEEEEEAELEITKESVNDAVEAGDKETLQAMCEELEIELKGLEKKSVKKMAEKITAKLPKESKSDKRGKKDKKEKEKVEEVEEETEEKQSLFGLIEEMVENGDKEKDIVKAVSPILEARGKKPLFIKKLVKQLIAIVETLND